MDGNYQDDSQPAMGPEMLGDNEIALVGLCGLFHSTLLISQFWSWAGL